MEKKASRKNESPGSAPAIEAKFEPRTIRLHAEPPQNVETLQVELEPTCKNAYFSDGISCETDYWPEMIDNPDFKLTTEQEEEVRKLRVLQFVGFDKTVTMELMMEDCVVVWPSDIIYGAQISSGAYKGVSLFVDGIKFEARSMRLEETLVVHKDKITVNRYTRTVNQRIREAVEKIQKGEIPMAAPKTETSEQPNFEPWHIQLLRKDHPAEDFVVELQPTCVKSWTALEYEGLPDEDIVETPREERDRERILRYVGSHKTLEVRLLQDDETVLLPVQIFYATEKVPGQMFTNVRIITADEKKVDAIKMRIKATEPDDNDRITVNQQALAAVKKQKGDPFAGLPVAKATKGWTAIVLPDGKTKIIFSPKKRKRSLVLRAIWGHCASKNTRTFSWPEVRDEYNKENPKEEEQVLSSRLEHDVFAGQNNEMREMFTRLGAAKEATFELKVRFVEE
jgi:hypothetical protein